MKEYAARQPARRRGWRRLRAGLLALMLGALGAGGCGPGEEATFPYKPMFVICPWAAGGGTSTVSMLVASLLEAETGMPVSVIHRTGGAGVTGHTAGAMADPDGHSILMITVEISMMHWRALTDISYRDYKPVMLMNRDAAAIFVRKEAPWQDLTELRAAIEANPGALRGSGTALGGIWHVALAGGLMAMGYEPTSVLWVPSQGSAPALQELISGGIDMAVCSLPEAQSLLGADEIRCVGVMAEQRDEKYPDVATFPEQGVDWSMGGWRGLAVPRATSDRRVAELEAIVRRVVDGPRFREEMTKLGYHIDVEGSEEFALTMATSDAALGKVIQEALKTEEGGDDGVPGPWLFPQILVAGLAILGVWIAAMRLRGGAQNEAASTTTTTTTTAAAAATTAGRGHWMRFVDVLVAVAFYVLVVDWLGFLLTAAAVSLYLFLRLGARWLPSLAVTVVLVPGIYLLFAKMLRVPLPTGLTPW